MQRYLLFFCWLCFSSEVAAQAVQNPVSAGFTRLDAYTALPRQAVSFGANQAALAHINNLTASVYGEKRFLLNELSFYQLAVAVPTATGHFGVQAATFGGEGYNESKVGLAYARSLGKAVSIGVQFNYFHYRMGGYGTAGAVNFEAGVLFNLSDQLKAGFHVYNPTRAALGKWEDERLPVVFTTGFGYEFSKKFLLAAEIIKEEAQPLNVHTGMQYQLTDQLVAKGGFATGPSAFYISAGYRLRLFQLEVVTSVHPQLGITPGIMLTFNSDEE
jgi:hypothetical protein